MAGRIFCIREKRGEASPLREEKMYHIRYYAIGHSYLRHGPFPGWQTEGFWGMAATAPEKDYFHRFQAKLSETFDCEVEALGENHATYERRCVEGATREDYTSSEEYAHMKEVLLTFKPNVISVFVGGGNTVANDDTSIGLFFDVLYELIAKYKRPEAVVVCPNLRAYMWPVHEKMAKKHGLTPIDVSCIHFTRGYENPYHAFNEYPEYDKMAAGGAVEFRTHPGDRGHDFIAEKMLDAVKDQIAALPQGKLGEEYSYRQYLLPVKAEKFEIRTEPEIFVNFYGFNIRNTENGVTFGSAPETGASLAAGQWFSPGYNQFYVEMAVSGAAYPTKLNVTLTRKHSDPLTFSETITDDGMHRYEFDLSDNEDWINSFRITPDTDECVLTVRALGFLE